MPIRGWGATAVQGAPYGNRREAGRRLADVLEGRRGAPVTVLALPRGGVPLGAEIADRLDAPLDIVVVRKIGAPGDPEYGLGAIAEGGIRFLDRAAIRELGIEPEDLEAEIRNQTTELERRVRMFRGPDPPASVEGRSAILVDDGMATGGTLRAAVQSVRLQRPRRITVAVGVASPEAMTALQPFVEEVVCPLIPPSLGAVAEWYRDFPQVSDAQVVDLLARHRERHGPPAHLG